MRRLISRIRSRTGTVIIASGWAAAAVTIVSLGTTLSNPDALLDRGFETALAEIRQVKPERSDARAALASEHLWLSRAEPRLPLGLAGVVTIGDRITINDAGGEARVLDVVEVLEIHPPSSLVETSTEPRLLLVICRLQGQEHARPVRFIIEAGDQDGQHPILTSAKARAL